MDRDQGRLVTKVNDFLASLVKAFPKEVREIHQRLYDLEREVHQFAKRWKKEVRDHKVDNQIFANVVQQREGWRTCVCLLLDIPLTTTLEEAQRLIDERGAADPFFVVSIPETTARLAMHDRKKAP